MPRVLAAVVAHNGETWLPDCLRALRAQTYPALGVIVVDAGSAESPEAIVRKEFPRAEFLGMARNAGFGAAANHALAHSDQSAGADFFLFLHDDVALYPDAVEVLVQAAAETDSGIMGGTGVDWDTPEVLVEVGMSADQFGYPFSGLEPGEIDQGQHGGRREVLFITSACVLASRIFVERCGSWDSGYFAFGEDLDLCMRARLAGFRVMVNPAARFRHAQAIATLQRRSEVVKRIRFYTRRNRPRAIAKNMSAVRVPILLLLYTVLALGELGMLAALGRFEELRSYPAAFFDFVRSVPDVVRRRRAVQKRRQAPDRVLRRYMVRDFYRARVFLERRLIEWGSGTLERGAQTLLKLRPAAIAATVGAWLRKPGRIAVMAVGALLMAGLRNVVFGPARAAGSLWPFPSSTGRLMSEYLSSWRNVGLGSASAAPPAFPLLWFAGVLGLGDPHRAQVVLVIGLVVLGMAGIIRLAASIGAAAPARVMAAAIYALSPPAVSAAAGGDLGALAVYGLLPHIALVGHRLLIQAREASAAIMARDAMRLALLTAALVALAPSALVLLVAFWLTLGAVGAWGRRDGLAWVVGATLGSLLLLIPWSLEALRPSGALLAPLLSGLRGGRPPGADWLGLHPLGLLSGSAPSIFGLAVVSLIPVAGVLLPPIERRRECRRLVALWVVFWAAAAGAALGWLPFPVSSRAMWMMVPLLALAMIAAQLVEGMREELPRRALGGRHAASVAGLLAAFALALVSWLPSLFSWSPAPSTLAANTGSGIAASASSFLTASAESGGDFRALWLGEAWVGPVRLGALDTAAGYRLTDPGGLTLLQAFSDPPSPGRRRLEGYLASMMAGKVDLAGHLLAPAGVRFLMIDPGDEAVKAAVARQRDLALRLQDKQLAIYENLSWIPRASVSPPELAAAASGDPLELVRKDWPPARAIPPQSATSFSGPSGRSQAPGLLLLADNFSTGWHASQGGQPLRHVHAFGWANGFRTAAGAGGRIEVSYGMGWLRGLWLLNQALLVAVAAMMAIFAGSAGRRAGWAV